MIVEMVENALIHLTEKKSIHTREGKIDPLGFVVGTSTRGGTSSGGAGTKNLEVLTSGGKFTTKGDAPFLVPHPGIGDDPVCLSLNIIKTTFVKTYLKSFEDSVGYSLFYKVNSHLFTIE